MMGGFFSAELKYAGVDMIVVEGASATPAYLFIDDDRVEVRDAAQYWGKGSVDTEYTLKADLGEDLPEYDWGTEQPDVLPVALNEEGALMILDLADGK